MEWRKVDSLIEDSYNDERTQQDIQRQLIWLWGVVADRWHLQTHDVRFENPFVDGKSHCATKEKRE